MSEGFGNITNTGVGGGNGSSFGEISKREKVCGIKLKIKFPVVAGEDSEGNANGNFYPTGEVKITQDGDKWGSKGQNGPDQEVELEVLGCEERDCGPTGTGSDPESGICSLEIDSSNTTLDSTPGAKSNVEVDVEAWFVCCVCEIGGEPTDKTCEECCTEENFTEEGGGDNCHLGAWRTGEAFDRGNEKVRTPSYSYHFLIGPPGKETSNLENDLYGKVRSDILSNASSSYNNTSCGYGSDDRG